MIDGITLKDNGFYVLLKGNEKYPPLIDEKINYRHFKIVGQAYAWLSVDDNLIFDSWENLRKTDDAVISDMLPEFGKKIIEHFPIIKRVAIGLGGKTPAVFAQKIIKKAEKMRMGTQYQDSKYQALIGFNDKFKLDLIDQLQANKQIYLNQYEWLVFLNIDECSSMTMINNQVQQIKALLEKNQIEEYQKYNPFVFLLIQFLHKYHLELSENSVFLANFPDQLKSIVNALYLLENENRLTVEDLQSALGAVKQTKLKAMESAKFEIAKEQLEEEYPNFAKIFIRLKEANILTYENLHFILMRLRIVGVYYETKKDKEKVIDSILGTLILLNEAKLLTPQNRRYLLLYSKRKSKSLISIAQTLIDLKEFSFTEVAPFIQSKNYKTFQQLKNTYHFPKETFGFLLASPSFIKAILNLFKLQPPYWDSTYLSNIIIMLINKKLFTQEVLNIFREKLNYSYLLQKETVNIFKKIIELRDKNVLMEKDLPLLFLMILDLKDPRYDKFRDFADTLIMLKKRQLLNDTLYTMLVKHYLDGTKWLIKAIDDLYHTPGNLLRHETLSMIMENPEHAEKIIPALYMLNQQWDEEKFKQFILSPLAKEIVFYFSQAFSDLRSREEMKKDTLSLNGQMLFQNRDNSHTLLINKINKQIESILKNGEFNRFWKDNESRYPQKWMVLEMLKVYLKGELALNALNLVLELNDQYDKGGIFRSDTGDLVDEVLMLGPIKVKKENQTVIETPSKLTKF